MLQQSEWFRPRPGHIVFCKETGARLGVVDSADGNICFYTKDCGHTTCYIWRFLKWTRSGERALDCLNKLHYTWRHDGNAN